MAYERIYRNATGRLRLPFADFFLLGQIHGVRIGRSEQPALQNMSQFLASLMILAERLKDHLSKYEPTSWINVPFDELFLDAQAVVLFFRQFMEDTAFVIRAVMPPTVRPNMPAGFTDLVARILASGPTKDSALAAVIPDTDPLRQFLAQEREWFDEVKDLRDDISHRTAFGRVRKAKFPSYMDMIGAGGGKQPFASSADLRSFLSGLFQRWLAFACLTSDFARRRLVEDHPDPKIASADSFMVRIGDIDFSKTGAMAEFPLGTTIRSVIPSRLDALEYFIGAPRA